MQLPGSFKISVVIAAYNSANYLPEALNSVLRQTQPAHEIIVIDDGSTDATEEIVKGYGNPIRYIHQENQGLAGARNTGIQAATGDWIALLDADDVCHETRLQYTAESIMAHPRAIVHYGAFEVFDQITSYGVTRAFPAKKLWPALRYRTPILPSTTTIRRAELLELGCFRKRTIEDWDLWFRIMQRYGQHSFQEIPESLIRYRRWEGSLSSKHLNMSNGMLELVDDLLLNDLKGLERGIWKRKIEARIHHELSIELRAIQDPRFIQHALLSMVKWPLFGKVVPAKRYKVLANMLLRDIASDFNLSKTALRPRY